MPAKVQRPQRGRTPQSRGAGQPLTRGLPAPIAGNPPQEIMQGEAPMALPKGGSPLRFDFGTLERSIGLTRPPLFPAGWNRKLIAPDVPTNQLSPFALRRLQTLPPELQHQVLENARAGQINIDDASSDLLANQLIIIGSTPGAPTLDDFAQLPDYYALGHGLAAYTPDEISEARGALIGPGGTEAPEPSNDAIAAEAQRIFSAATSDDAFIIPPETSLPWTPEEDFLATEQEGE